MAAAVHHIGDALQGERRMNFRIMCCAFEGVVANVLAGEPDLSPSASVAVGHNLLQIFFPLFHRITEP